jgi:hypothetical protein
MDAPRRRSSARPGESRWRRMTQFVMVTWDSRGRVGGFLRMIRDVPGPRCAPSRGARIPWVVSTFIVGASLAGFATPVRGQATLGGMSPQCQEMVNGYIQASEKSDGATALSLQNSIRKAGGCGVLAGEAPAGGDPRFVARGAKPNIDANIVACHQSPAECAAQMRRLEQASSPEAQARLMMDAINQGLALGQAMAGVMRAAVPQKTDGYSQKGAFNDCKNLAAASGNYAAAAKCGQRETDMNSLAAPIIKNGVGQGSPGAARK